MSICIGINGFGRIGRNAARVILRTDGLTLGAINSGSDKASHEYLLRHDSVQGPFVADLSRVAVHQIPDAAEIPWDVDVVLDCTGKAKTVADARSHLKGSVKQVVVSAPMKDAPTYIMGVNHLSYSGESVVSNSSCTTNSVTTVLKVLHNTFGVIRGNMTTVHAATDSQNILDNSHKKEIRLRRNTLVNIIPAKSGSANDVAKLFPHLKGKLPCRAIRVPTPTVSLIDLVVEVEKKTDSSAVIAAFVEAAGSKMKGILGVASEELVSSDYIGSPYSSVVDPFLTDVVNDTLIHVTAWYDNEWGYANRLVELASYLQNERYEFSANN